MKKQKKSILLFGIIIFTMLSLLPNFITNAQDTRKCPEWIGDPPGTGIHEIFTANCTSDFCGNISETYQCSAVIQAE